ncbi:MAG: hypothetical protein A2X12_05500 [Bacteroidetes bacterium GWE2_29_8]|nr:MAG: hypothetical protein A2X12_05500 [Bacteroidetes bacterium GWE2_29_8]
MVILKLKAFTLIEVLVSILIIMIVFFSLGLSFINLAGSQTYLEKYKAYNIAKLNDFIESEEIYDNSDNSNKEYTVNKETEKIGENDVEGVTIISLKIIDLKRSKTLINVKQYSIPKR